MNIPQITPAPSSGDGVLAVGAPQAAVVVAPAFSDDVGHWFTSAPAGPRAIRHILRALRLFGGKP